MTAGATAKPRCFGPSARRLFGIYHPPAEGSAGRPAVVLCNPFGQEAIRAQRMMRVLGERLARNGHAVLRFDYFGTGDSLGDDIEGDLEGWALDVMEAHRRVAARLGRTADDMDRHAARRDDRPAGDDARTHRTDPARALGRRSRRCALSRAPARAPCRDARRRVQRPAPAFLRRSGGAAPRPIPRRSHRLRAVDGSARAA